MIKELSVGLINYSTTRKLAYSFIVSMKLSSRFPLISARTFFVFRAITAEAIFTFKTTTLFTYTVLTKYTTIIRVGAIGNMVNWFDEESCSKSRYEIIIIEASFVV